MNSFFFFHDDSEISDCITFSESVIDIDQITKASKLLRLTSVVFVFFLPPTFTEGLIGVKALTANGYIFFFVGINKNKYWSRPRLL